MSNISLICLDFDGTVMTYDEEPGFFHPLVVETLNELEPAGTRWCTNSGRDRESQLRILQASRQRGLQHMPSALLCGESLIFERRDGGYVPFEPWNTRAQARLRALHSHVQAVVRPLLDAWAVKYTPAVYMGDEYTSFNVVDDGHRPYDMGEDLVGAIAGLPGAMVTRNGGWLSVLPVELGKGNVLRGYLSAVDVPAAYALAIGDHLNDLSMLDGTAARLVGCPANAVPEVVWAVREARGYAAAAEGPLGTVEVIRHYLERMQA